MILQLFSNGFTYENFLLILLLIPTLLFSLSCHEFAHAFAAWKQGDGYARAQGRMTLNPIKHLDPFGTILLLLVGFGWAKPVPVNPGAFRHGRRSEFLVSIAGILANVMLAFIAVFFGRFFSSIIYPNVAWFSDTTGFTAAQIIYLLFQYLAYVNLTLAVFNLLPIPPLDGYRILVSFLPWRMKATTMMFLERYGFFILIALMVFGDRLGFLSTVSGALFDGIDWLVGLIFSGVA
ncbi:MAG: site-2 protease family protein [Clostridia bacterium]|nr:site-2 protease family protein [Clostridia bacterium]